MLGSVKGAGRTSCFPHQQTLEGIQAVFMSRKAARMTSVFSEVLRWFSEEGGEFLRKQVQNQTSLWSDNWTQDVMSHCRTRHFPSRSSQMCCLHLLVHLILLQRTRRHGGLQAQTATRSPLLEGAFKGFSCLSPSSQQ